MLNTAKEYCSYILEGVASEQNPIIQVLLPIGSRFYFKDQQFEVLSIHFKPYGPFALCIPTDKIPEKYEMV